MERQLWNAAFNNRAYEVAALLRDHPDVDVNWANKKCQHLTALHSGCCEKNVEVVKLLLAHPRINVNSRCSTGSTPIHTACFWGNTSVVRVLLEDPRVDAGLADGHGRTALWWASNDGYHEVVKWLIASGKDLGDLNKLAVWFDQEFTPLEIAVKEKHLDVVSLLERFIENPDQTRYDVRLELGMLSVPAAAHFATIIFLCDGLLQVKGEEKGKETAAARFFTIAQRLPMDLQMTLANRAVGSVKDNVRSRDSESAFRELARVWL